MSRQLGLSVVDLIVACVLIAIVITLALTISSARHASGESGRETQNNVYLRGLHVGIVRYALGNDGWFPGLDANGNGNPTVEDRYRLLLLGNFVTGDHVISPGETRSAWIAGNPLKPDNYSYAMLQINPGVVFDPAMPLVDGTPHARRKEWRETFNSDAPVLSDRNTALLTAPQSIWRSHGSDWRGSVAYNDNHVVFETRHVLPKTIYSTVENTDDHLFEATGDSDALLIFSGTGE